MLAKLKKWLQRVFVIARFMVHVVSFVNAGLTLEGAWEDLRAKPEIVALFLPFLLRYEWVREKLVDPATYVLAVELIGAYGPWVCTPLLLLLLGRRAYRRGRAIEEGRTEQIEAPRRESLSAEPPAPSDEADPSERELFASWADEALEFLQYWAAQDSYAPHVAVEYQTQFYSLVDRLSDVGVSFPTDLSHPDWQGHAAMLVGLMRNGNLEKAGRMFPLKRSSP